MQFLFLLQMCMLIGRKTESVVTLPECEEDNNCLTHLPCWTRADPGQCPFLLSEPLPGLMSSSWLGWVVVCFWVLCRLLGLNPKAGNSHIQASFTLSLNCVCVVLGALWGWYASVLLRDKTKKGSMAVCSLFCLPLILLSLLFPHYKFGFILLISVL